MNSLELIKKEAAMYLRGFADGDGYVRPIKGGVYRIELTNTNKEILSAIKNYLDILGIKYVMNKRSMSSTNKLPSWRILISKYENLIKWNAFVGFNHPKKQKRLTAIINKLESGRKIRE